MTGLRPIRSLFTILVVAMLASCTKEEPVKPHDCHADEDVQTKALLNNGDDGRPGLPHDVDMGKGDPSLMLRDGGTGEEGEGGGGGISDDGDDEADGERNKKDQH